MLVDLDVTGLQLGPQAQAGITGTQIIDGNRQAGFAVLGQRPPHAAVIFQRVTLAQFQHHPVHRQTAGDDPIDCALRPIVRVQHQGRHDVHEQQPGQVQGREPLRRQLAAQQVELDHAVAMLGGAEQHQRVVHHAVGRAAHQRLVTHHGPAAQ